MDLYQDEALEKKPTICLDNRQIQNLKIQQAQVGQVFSLKAAAKVVAMSAGTGEDGLPNNELRLELESVEIEQEHDPMDTIRNMYPSHKVTGV